jgi:signal transduction histidine kinase
MTTPPTATPPTATPPTAAAAAPAPARARRWPRLPRRTVRLRLTLVYGGLFLVAGAGLLAITYALLAQQLPVATAAKITSGGPGGSTATFCAAGPAGPIASPGQISNCLLYAQSVATRTRSNALNELLATSGIALAIMAVVSVALGWLVAGRVLRPLRTITTAARRMSASSLHQRLALAGPDDELKELGDTFDGLLARLEASFRAQRQFVANASHELRTPLARQQTVVEVALTDPQPTIASLQAACRQVLAAGAQQERLIEALLTLARSERGLDRWEPVDLTAVTGEALLTRHDEAGLRGVRIDSVLGPATAFGDSRLAERLVANLVDNALQHNVPGGRVEVATRTGAGRVTLSVANTGPVIPPDQVGRLFQPFQRLGGERTASRDGLGLGLTIAAAIAAAHGAELRARPLPGGGLAVEVWFIPPPGEPALIGAQQPADRAMVAGAA